MEASSKLLLHKLGVKEGVNAVFLHVPDDVKGCCDHVSRGASVCHKLDKSHDLILTFHDSSQALKIELPQLKQALKPSGLIWVCWRRGEVTDLSRDLVWQLGEECGLSSIASVAIGDDWSAMKLMHPKDQRRMRGA